MEQESKDITWSGKSLGQRGQEACVSEARGGAVVGKEAVVNNDERLQRGQL